MIYPFWIFRKLEQTPDPMGWRITEIALLVVLIAMAGYGIVKLVLKFL